jgi:hypothetical protein
MSVRALLVCLVVTGCGFQSKPSDMGGGGMIDGAVGDGAIGDASGSSEG